MPANAKAAAAWLQEFTATSGAGSKAMANVWSGKLSPRDGLLQAKQQVDAVLATLQ